MKQFNIKIMGAQKTGLFIGFFSFYYYMVKLVIPNVLGINKLRIKKLSQNITEKTFIEKEVNQFLKLVNYKLKTLYHKGKEIVKFKTLKKYQISNV
jgi:F0F1-type ATP synthase membrane subunit b/b'